MLNKNKLKTACLENAKELLNGAKILFQYQKYSHATALAILSYEETLKASFIVLWKQKIVSKKFIMEKVFKDHLTKLLLEKSTVSIFEKKSKNKKIYKTILQLNKDKTYAIKINSLKKRSLYVDLDGINGQIYSPNNSVTTATKYINLANERLIWEIALDDLKLFSQKK
jgi:AbiV family abortive infection protein